MGCIAALDTLTVAIMHEAQLESVLTRMRAGCMSKPMYRTGLLCADTASGDSSMLATVCPSSPNLRRHTCCTPGPCAAAQC